MHSRLLPQLTLVFAVLPGLAGAQRNSPSPGPLEVAELVEIRSAVLDETRTLRIALPESYETEEMGCPVLYLLDGQTLFLQALGSVRHLGNRGFPGFLLVAIDNTERTRDLTPAGGEASRREFPTSGGSRDFRRFLVDELQPYIEKNYHTNGMSVLAGHSFGGLFAADCLLEEPEAFGGYLVLSPSLWWDKRNLVRRFRELPAEHALWSRFVYLSMGEEGGSMNAPFEETVWSLRDRAPDTFHWEVGRFAGHDHWSVALPSFDAGLRAYTRPAREAPRGVGSWDELEAAFRSLRAIYGVDLPVSSSAAGSAAQELSKKGKLDAALELLAQAIERFPRAPRLYSTKGGLHQDAGRFEDAIACYDQGIARLEGDAEMAGWVRALRRARGAAALQREASGGD